MRRIALGLLAVLVSAATPAGTRLAFAHGGAYRGPAGEVPPDSRDPQDPPPPDAGGGTPTPPGGGGGEPTPPGGGGGEPTPPGGGGTPDGPENPPGGTPGSGPGSGTPTRKLPSSRPVTYDSWRFWWAYNRDRLLGDAARSAADTGVGGITVLSDGGNGNETLPQDLTAKSLEARAIPSLRRFATDDAADPEIRAAALLSLAKIGRAEILPLLLRLSRAGGVVGRDAQVEETATLSLGVLGERTAGVRAHLVALARDPAARRRTRCFAAFALGLLGDREAPAGSDPATLDALLALVPDPGTPQEVRASALVAVGLLGDETAVPRLLPWLESGRAGRVPLDDVAASYVAAAIGKIGKPGSREVADALIATLSRRGRFTRYSAAIALGQIAPFADAKVQALCVRALGQVVRSEGKDGFDAASANFALAALGRAGAAAATPEVRAAAGRELQEAFDERPRHRPFAALGLGLLGRDLSGPERTSLAEGIRDAFARSAGDPEPRAALAVALGLLRSPDSRTVLEDELANGKDTALRGSAAVALGMIGDPASVVPVHRALVEKGDRTLLLDTALAAGLLRDAGAVPFLSGVLRDSQSSVFSLGCAAQALGRIGDGRAVDPLADILEDPLDQYQVLTRALAAVALGQIGDRNRVPVLSLLSEDVNYRASYEAIAEVLTIL